MRTVQNSYLATSSVDEYPTNSKWGHKNQEVFAKGVLAELRDSWGPNSALTYQNRWGNHCSDIAWTWEHRHRWAFPSEKLTISSKAGSEPLNEQQSTGCFYKCWLSNITTITITMKFCLVPIRINRFLMLCFFSTVDLVPTPGYKGHPERTHNVEPVVQQGNCQQSQGCT